MNIAEVKEIFDAGWPDSQKMQRKFDAGKWLISEVERLEKATMDERQRCANIARSYCVLYPKSSHDDAVDKTAYDIAEEIEKDW
jgi:hypothetical protein